MDIQWEDPPQHVLQGRREIGKYREFAAALREHKGRWAVLPSPSTRTEKGAKGTALNIKRGNMTDFRPKGAWDAVADGTKIWVMYKGEEDAEKQPEQKPRQQKARAPQSDDGPTVGEVRAWAKQQGMDVADRGVLSPEIFDKYREAVERGESGLGMRVVRD